MNDLAIQLTEDGSRHLYEQIYEYIRDEIKAVSYTHLTLPTICSV